MKVQSNINTHKNSRQNTNFGMIKVQCGMKNFPSLKMIDEYKEAGKYAKGFVSRPKDSQGRLIKGTFYDIFKTMFDSNEERELLKLLKADSINAKSITTNEGETLLAGHKEYETNFEKFI